MAITTRQTTGTGVTAKNAPLTHAELDQNFIDIVQGKILPAIYHQNVISGDMYIPENVNALSILPISIPTGTTVTVGSGSTWNFLDLS